MPHFDDGRKDHLHQNRNFSESEATETKTTAPAQFKLNAGKPLPTPPPTGKDSTRTDSLSNFNPGDSTVTSFDSLFTVPSDTLSQDSLQADTIPAFSPLATDSVAADTASAKVQPGPKEEKKALKEESASIFSENVGEGACSKPGDVLLAVQKFNALNFLSAHELVSLTKERKDWEQAGGGDFPSATINKIIFRYQKDVLKYKRPDGVITKGKGTEKALMAGKGAIEDKKKSGKDSGPSAEEQDLTCIANELYAAGQGWNTDEDRIYQHLEMVQGNASRIKALKEKFCELYDVDLEAYLKDGLWDWGPFKEESKALGMLGGASSNTDEELEKEFPEIPSLLTKDDWHSQSPSAPPKYKDNQSGWSNCKYVCANMIYDFIYPDLPSNFKHQTVENDPKREYAIGSMGSGEFLAVGSEQKSNYKDITTGQHMQSELMVSDDYQTAISYVTKNLSEGRPVEVGVDHTFNTDLSIGTTGKNTAGYNEYSTDHFVVITGQGTENGQRYFQFFDPGTTYVDNGTDGQKENEGKGNRLIEKEPGIWQGSQPFTSKDGVEKIYTLTSVLLFRKDLQKHEKAIGSNLAEIKRIKNAYKNKTGDFGSK